METHIQIGNESPRAQYQGNGVQTQFTYPFPIFEVPDLEVYLDAVKQSVGFTVSGAGISDGGTVDFDVAPATDVIVTLARRLAIQRTSDFQESGAFRSKVINDELDYLTAALQQVSDDQGRSIQMAITEFGNVDTVLPTPQPNVTIVWNGTADGFVNGPTVGEVRNAETYAQNASDSANAAAMSKSAAADFAAAASGSAAVAVAATASNIFTKLLSKSSIDAPYMIVANSDDGTLFVSDMSTGSLTYNLPSIATALEGERYGVLRVGATNVLTLVRDGTDTINGVAGDYVVTANDGELVVLVSDMETQNNWVVVPWSQAIADEVTLTKSASTLSVKADGVGVAQLAAAAKPYDIAFIAGFDSSMTAEPVVVQVYGELVMTRSGSFTGEAGYIDTAATGAAAIVDILKNGMSIYTVAPQFAAAANTLTAGTLKTDGTEDYVSGDRVTFKVTQIGSVAAGSGLRFTVKGVLA